MLKRTILDPNITNSTILLRDLLFSEIYPTFSLGRPIVILCIGTDRSTGDSLGPLVGYKLVGLLGHKINLYGSLQYPVHAKNLNEVLININNTYKDPFIIAIDACLGSIQNVGKLIIDKKPLKPGSAMEKELPPVGDMSITGVVNISGGMEFILLQNTRLFTVMSLADSISRGIYYCLLKIYNLNNKSDDFIFNS